MAIEKIFVAGAGLMGSGIAQVCAQAGYDVTLQDMADDILNKSLEKIRWSVGKLVEKSKLAEKTDTIMDRLRVTTDLDASSADFVFEVIVEKMEAKQALFAELDGICPAHTIFASNTSAIPITQLAAATARPANVCGTHFFSPVPMMRAVEIVKGPATATETVETADRLCQSLGKETIRVNMDVAGIVLNRINFPSTIEAIRLVEAGVADVADIDKGMRLGFGRPMGPFETADMVGLDIGYHAFLAVYEETRDPKFYPPMLLQRKIMLGQLGRKTGVGWYRYDSDGRKLGPAD